MTDEWRKYLLKSGLPFEYEVKENFVRVGCTVWDEFSYLKQDENDIEKEFSYDLDVNAWNGDCSINFMVECKYKTEATRWVFTPDPYAYQDDLSQNAWLHPSDHFCKNSFLFCHSPFDKVLPAIGPFCLKGIEILNKDFQEVTIKRAISQLSYAFIDKIVSSFNEQLNTPLFKNTIFLHVPIIITNADLYLMKTEVTTQTVSGAKDMEDIATKHDFLCFHNKTGEHLRMSNLTRLLSFFANQKKKILKSRLSTFTKEIDHLTEVIAKHYSPQIILIMHHESKNYKALLDYVNFITKDSQELRKRMDEVQQEAERRHKEFERKIAERKKNKI